MPCDYFMLSLKAEPFARTGMPKIIRNIKKYENAYKRLRGKEIAIIGGIVSQYEKSINLQETNYELIKEDLDECTNGTTSLFDTIIPKATVVQEAVQGDGAVLFHSPSDEIVKNFFDLSIEILERILISKMSEEG